jgi:hypothetical protein
MHNADIPSSNLLPACRTNPQKRVPNQMQLQEIRTLFRLDSGEAETMVKLHIFASDQSSENVRGART